MSEQSATIKAPEATQAPDTGNAGPLNAGGDSAMYDSMRELEAMDSPEAKASKREATQKRPPQKDSTSTQDAENAEPASSDGKTSEQSKSENKEEQDTSAKPASEQKPVKAAELRAAYERSKATLKERDSELTKLREELKTLKSKPAEDPEIASIKTRYEAAEKRRQELENEIKFVNYQKSEEFVTKYKQPYEEAWHKAVNELSELTVEDDQGNSRKATAQDLLALSNMPLGDARKLAKQMFGDAADDVMAHRRRIRDLADAQNKAIEEAQKHSVEHAKQQSEQMLQHQQKIAKLWTDENTTWQEKFPRWFKEVEGDDEGNALLAKGFAMADAAFRPNGLPPEQMVKLHAEMRNKAAGFSRMALHLKKARERIKDLELSLSEYENSTPPAGDGGSNRVKAPDPDSMFADADTELDSLDRKRR